jgi:hypothetical protein
MKTYTIAVSLLLSVAAPGDSEAVEAVKDTFGEGEICGIDIKDLEVELLDEL